MFDSDIEGRALTAGPEQPEHEEAVSWNAVQRKLGGNPKLIEDEGESDVARIVDLGMNFLFQFEDSYPDGMKVKTLPFGGGDCYVFCKFAANGSIDPGQTAAFWQIS